MAPSTPEVSVIIPVYNDAARLELCLLALGAQTLPPSKFEVIVVDNGSTDGVADVLARFPEVTKLHEPKAGSYRARNAGLLVARCDVLAFTDSDCLPAPDWLERGLACLPSNAGCGFVAGHVEMFARDPRKPTPVELHQLLFDLKQDRLVEQGFAATANMFTSRSVMDRVGPFNAALKSGGDYEWGRRATGLGLPGIYAVDVVVRHPARRTYRELGRKVRRLAGARYDGRTNAPFGAETTGSSWAARTFLPLLRMLKRLAGDDALVPPADRLRLLPVVLFVWFAGAAEGLRLRAGGESLR